MITRVSNKSNIYNKPSTSKALGMLNFIFKIGNYGFECGLIYLTLEVCLCNEICITIYQLIPLQNCRMCINNLPVSDSDIFLLNITWKRYVYKILQMY